MEGSNRVLDGDRDVVGSRRRLFFQLFLGLCLVSLGRSGNLDVDMGLLCPHVFQAAIATIQRFGMGCIEGLFNLVKNGKQYASFPHPHFWVAKDPATFVTLEN